MNNNNEIYYQLTFTGQELEGIQGLEAEGTEKGVCYKIDPGTNSGIIYAKNGIPVGFMTVDCFGNEDIESAAIVNNTTDWDKMAAVLISYAKEKMAKRILFICDPSDVIVTQKLESAGLVPLFSEYRMAFDAASFSPAAIHDISVRRATQTDYSYIRELDEKAFGKDNHTSQCDVCNTQIILQNNLPVGKLRIEESDGNHGIYGVVVERRLRGKGIGAQALTLLLNELMTLDVPSIYLEVDSENPAAFHLYKKLGFKVMSEFHYYPYKL